MGIVDGYTGTLYIEPDEETMKKYEAKKPRMKIRSVFYWN